MKRMHAILKRLWHLSSFSIMMTKKIRIKGKVQGVFFRQTALEKARSLGVRGTVENLEDGHTVEIIATAAGGPLASFIEWCQRGPQRAEVSGVEISELSLQEFEKFSIL